MAKQQDPKKKAEEIKDSFDDVTLSIKDLEKELSKVFNTKKLDNFVKSLTAGFEDSIDYSDKIQEKITKTSKSVTSLSKEFGSLRGELNSFSKDISNLKIPTLNIISNINEVDISTLQESIKNLPDIKLNAVISNVDISELDNIDIKELNGSIKYTVQPIEIPKIEDIESNVKFNVQNIDLPKIEDISASIKFNTQLIDLPNVNDINAQINYLVQPIDLPTVSDINANINYSIQPIDLPKVEDINANIKFNVQDLDLPNFNDISINAKLNKIDLSELDKMPISELMAEIGLVDTSLLDKTIDKYNPIILSSIIDTPDVSELSNIAKAIPSVQLQADINVSNTTAFSDITAQAQDQANAIDDVNSNINLTSKAANKLQKQYDAIIKKIQQSNGAVNLTKTDMKIIAEHNKMAIKAIQDTSKAQNDFSLATYKTVDGQKKYNDIVKELATYDGPRFKAAGMITSELHKQLSASEMITKSKSSLEKLDDSSVIYSKILSTEGKTQEQIANNSLKLQQEIESVLQNNSFITSTLNDLESQISDKKNKINILSEMGLGNSESVKNLESEINDAISERNNLTKQSYALEDKLSGLLNDQSNLDFSARVTSSEQLAGVFTELNKLTNEQATGQSDLVKKMKEVENSARALGTSEFRQIDLTDEINDKLSEQKSLEIARTAILDTNNGLTEEHRTKALGLVDANIKINQEQLNQTIALQKASEAYSVVQEKAEGMRDTMMSPVDKLFGIVPSNVSKMLGLDKVKEQISNKVFKSITDGFMSAGGGASGFFSAASAGASTLMASLAPILPLLLAIAAVVGLVKLFMDADKQVSDLAHNLNISYKEAGKLQNTAVDIATEMNVAGMNTAEVTKQMIDLQQATGLNVGLLASQNKQAKDLLATSTMLTTQYGLSAEETMTLNAAAAIGGGTLDKMALAAEKFGEDGLVPAGEIMKDIAKTSKTVLMNFKGDYIALARATKQARLMGTTLDKMSSAGESLLNIESSITAQNKARMMLGRNINLDAARYYALQGDTEGLMQEMVKAAGSVEDYDRMSVLQKKALAEAMGMQVSDLDEMMMKQKELNTLGIDANKLQEIMTKAKDGTVDLEKELAGMKDDEARKLLKQKVAEEQRAGIQEKLASTMQKVTDLLYKMVAPLLPMIDSFVDSLGDGSGVLQSLSDTFSGIGKFISSVLIPILKVTWSPIMATFSFFKTIIDKIGEAMDGIFGPVKEGESSFSALGAVAKVLGKIFSGIGVVIADYMLRPFMRIAGIIGGVIKIFNGDFAGGIKQIGGAILSYILLPFEMVGDFIDEVFGTNLVDSVKEVFSKIGDAIIDTLGGAWDVIAGIFTLDGDRILDGIKSIGKGLYNALVQPFMDAWDWITGFFGGNSPSKLGESIVVGISSVAESLFDFITWPFKKAWDFIGNLFGMGDLGSTIIDGFKSVFGEIGDMIMEYVGGAWDVVSGIFTLDGDKILEGLKSIGNSIISMLTYPFEKAMNLIGKLFGVKELGSSIIKSIKSFGKKVIENIKAPFVKAIDWISETFGGIGGKLIDGISNIASSIWNFITTPFKKAWEWITGLFSGTGKKIIDGISNLATDVWNTVTGAFKSGYDWVVDMFSGVGGKIVDGISSVGGAIVDAITAPFTQAWDAVSGWLGFSPSELGNGIVKGISSVSGDVESNLTKPFDSAEKKVSASAAAMADSVSGISGNASISISGIDTAGISQIKDIEKDLRRIKVDVIEEKLGDLSDAFSAMDWSLLKEFANLATVNLGEAGKSLINGINSLTGISKSVNLDKLEDVFDQLSDTLDELDWENLKTFSGLATTNLAAAGKSLIDGINSLTGISDKVNLDKLEDTFSQLTDTLDELDWENLKTFAQLATTNLAAAGKSLIDGINSLTGVSDKVNLDKLETTFSQLTDSLDELNWENLKIFATLATTNLAAAGKALIDGINSLTGISDKVNLDKLKDVFEKLTDTLDELDWEDLKVFASLATSNLANAGSSIIAGINSLAGIKDKINLGGAEDAFEALNDVLDELDLDAIKKFADLAGKNLAASGTNIKNGLVTLGTIKEVKLDGVEDVFENMSDVIDKLDLELINKFATADFTKLNTNVTAISNAMTTLSTIGTIDLSGISDKGELMTSFLDDISDIDYDDIDGLADALLNLADSYADLSTSIKDISDEDIARIQQVSTISGNSSSSGLSSMISNLFGGSNDDEETTSVSANTPKPAATATAITPVMQPVATVNTQPADATQSQTTINNQNNNAKLEGLVRELIAKVEQPVIIKLGEKTVAEMQSAISFRKSYGANVNGYRS